MSHAKTHTTETSNWRLIKYKPNFIQPSWKDFLFLAVITLLVSTFVYWIVNAQDPVPMEDAPSGPTTEVTYQP